MRKVERGKSGKIDSERDEEKRHRFSSLRVSSFVLLVLFVLFVP
jgi:hypothetical protein